MTHSSSAIAAQLSERYRGIEGFYLLNRSGQLGYVASDGMRLARETMEGVAAGRTALFFDELAHCTRSSPPDADKELGYLLPVDGSRLWRTATLVLHVHVAKALKDAFDRDLTQGRMSLAQGDRKVQDISPERGLHRGFEDLLNHVGSFGMQPYFPILYIRPAETDAAGEFIQPVRVLNLMSLMPNAGRFADVLLEMKRNLAARGALKQASRVEHRFTLQDEL